MRLIDDYRAGEIQLCAGIGADRDKPGSFRSMSSRILHDALHAEKHPVRCLAPGPSFSMEAVPHHAAALPTRILILTSHMAMRAGPRSRGHRRSPRNAQRVLFWKRHWRSPRRGVASVLRLGDDFRGYEESRLPLTHSSNNKRYEPIVMATGASEHRANGAIVNAQNEGVNPCQKGGVKRNPGVD